MSVDLGSKGLETDILQHLLGEKDLFGSSVDEQRYLSHLLELAMLEEGEFQVLTDPFDRSIALLFEMVKSEDFDPWDIDLNRFIKLFSHRIGKAKGLDLPACGKVLRMAWDVLKTQAEVLLERQYQIDEEMDEDYIDDFGWETDFDDEDFEFTRNIVTGAGQEAVPRLLDERLRREEGRPVTLAELMKSLQVAQEEVEVNKLRAESRVRYQKEVSAALGAVDSTIHDEDFESDKLEVWLTIKKLANGDDPLSFDALIDELSHQRGCGIGMEGCSEAIVKDNARISAFVSALILSKDGFIELWQMGLPDGPIYLRDIWPNHDDWDKVAEMIEVKQGEELISETPPQSVGIEAC